MLKKRNWSRTSLLIKMGSLPMDEQYKKSLNSIYSIHKNTFSWPHEHQVLTGCCSFLEPNAHWASAAPVVYPIGISCSLSFKPIQEHLKHAEKAAVPWREDLEINDKSLLFAWNGLMLTGLAAFTRWTDSPFSDFQLSVLYLNNSKHPSTRKMNISSLLVCNVDQCFELWKKMKSRKQRRFAYRVDILVLGFLSLLFLDNLACKSVILRLKLPCSHT